MKIRAGTRWYRRGIDKDGNVANFVETEQIVESGEGDRASFVQVNYKLLNWIRHCETDLRHTD